MRGKRGRLWRVMKRGEVDMEVAWYGRKGACLGIVEFVIGLMSSRAYELTERCLAETWIRKRTNVSEVAS